MTEEDRKQIGLTDDGKATVAILTQKLGWFRESQDAARFALGYAIREGVEPGLTTAPVETRWSPDLFDPSGEIRGLLRALHPKTKMQVRLMEYLIEEGLRRIAAKVTAGEEDPLAYLG